MSWRRATRRHDRTGSSVTKSLMTTSMARRAVRRTRASPTLSLVFGRARRCRHQSTHELREVADATGRAELELDPVADQDQPGAVAVLNGGRRQKCGRLCGSVGLGRPFGPESHARRNVDDQPERQGSLLDESPHEWPALPRGHVPVEMAHVVPRLVSTQLGERQANARSCSVIGPGELRYRSRTDPEPEPSRTLNNGRGIEWRRPSSNIAAAKGPEHVQVTSTPAKRPIG